MARCSKRWWESGRGRVLYDALHYMYQFAAGTMKVETIERAYSFIKFDRVIQRKRQESSAAAPLETGIHAFPSSLPSPREVELVSVS